MLLDRQMLRSRVWTTKEVVCLVLQWPSSHGPRCLWHLVARLPCMRGKGWYREEVRFLVGVVVVPVCLHVNVCIISTCSRMCGRVTVCANKWRRQPCLSRCVNIKCRRLRLFESKDKITGMLRIIAWNAFASKFKHQAACSIGQG